MSDRVVNENWVNYLRDFFEAFKFYITGNSDTNLEEIKKFKYDRFVIKGTFYSPDSRVFLYQGYDDDEYDTSRYLRLASHYDKNIESVITYLDENLDRIIDYITTCPCEDFEIQVELDQEDSYIHLNTTSLLKVGDKNGFIE